MVVKNTATQRRNTSFLTNPAEQQSTRYFVTSATLTKKSRAKIRLVTSQTKSGRRTCSRSSSSIVGRKPPMKGARLLSAVSGTRDRRSSVLSIGSGIVTSTALPSTRWECAKRQADVARVLHAQQTRTTSIRFSFGCVMAQTFCVRFNVPSPLT